MPRTGLSPEAIRARAIEIAEEKIRLFGFDRMRLADVAREMGVSHVALYKHFPDKAALLDAVNDRWLAAVDERLQRIADGEGPAVERLIEWFVGLHRAKREKVLRDPELYRGFHAASEELKPSVLRHLAAAERQATSLVVQAIEEGTIGEGDAAAISRTLRELTVGFHHPHLVRERRDEEREPELRAVLVTLLRAFRPGSTA